MVMIACDDEVVPFQERVEAVTDDADIEEVHNTERNLMYVACARARSAAGDQRQSRLGVS